MRCRRIQGLLPLMAGGDLSPHKSDLVQKHVELCASCRQELRLYRLSLESAKAWLASGSPDWRESEWIKSLEMAAAFKEKAKTPLAPWPYRKGWAMAVMAATVVVLALFVFHPLLIKNKRTRMAAAPSRIIKPEVLSMRLVSEETGLKINWFFRKDLKLEVME